MDRPKLQTVLLSLQFLTTFVMSLTANSEILKVAKKNLLNFQNYSFRHGMLDLTKSNRFIIFKCIIKLYFKNKDFILENKCQIHEFTSR